MKPTEYDQYIEDRQYKDRCITSDLKKDMGLEKILAKI
jgi:hypothetical protein